MITLKSLTLDYAKQIDKFWSRDWSEYTLPDDTLKIIDAVAVDTKTNTPIAYGQVRHFAELMLFTDMEAPHKDRVEALKMLMLEAYMGVDLANLSECYCLVKDMRFARLIAKHFDFHLVENPGVLLIKKVR